MPVIIESLIQRPGGTTVHLDGVAYHFTPDSVGRHTCAVANTSHMQTLLAIKEGYRFLGAVEGEAAPPPALGAAPGLAAPGVDPLLAVSTMNSDIDPVAVAAANAARDAEEDAKRAAEEAIRKGGVAPVVAQVPVAQDGDDTRNPEDAPVPAQLVGQAVDDGLTPDMPREQLGSIMEAELGRSPSPRAKPETIIAQIVQGRRERAAGA
jgi:hypothetical protein